MSDDAVKDDVKINVVGHIKIFDPDTNEVFISKRDDKPMKGNVDDE